MDRRPDTHDGADSGEEATAISEHCHSADNHRRWDEQRLQPSWEDSSSSSSGGRGGDSRGRSGVGVEEQPMQSEVAGRKRWGGFGGNGWRRVE